ncbi:TolB family protein [Kitasatospora herbaricolor]|uniref:TolB family protein n=1 Tax=Kitasatospora herbaricolor TaxID=68217 RepID=UPI0036D79D17
MNGTGRTRRLAIRGAVALTAVALATTVTPAGAAGGPARTEQVDVGPGGARANAQAYGESLSADGRFAVFSSEADNLVPGDTNGFYDVFVRDLRNGRTERVSVGTGGVQGNAFSSSGVASADGRYIAFASDSDNLVPGDTNGAEDIFVRDRQTGRTERLTAGDPAQQQPGGSDMPSISWDGRYVAFASGRSDLVPGDTNNAADIFVVDRWTGTTTRATVGADGGQADSASTRPVLSADGSKVGFTSRAGNLLPGAPVRAEALAGPQVTQVTQGADGPQIDKPRVYPYYVRDLRAGRTVGGSVDAAGELIWANTGSLSADGRYVVFSTNSETVTPGDTNHQIDVFVRDLATGRNQLVSAAADGTQGDGMSWDGVISADGRRVYFSSDATGLVPGDTNQAQDVFRRDLRTGRVERVSVAADGTQSTGNSSGAVIDARGAAVLFSSDDGTLVPQDTDGHYDVFLRRLPLG